MQRTERKDSDAEESLSTLLLLATTLSQSLHRFLEAVSSEYARFQKFINWLAYELHAIETYDVTDAKPPNMGYEQYVDDISGFIMNGFQRSELWPYFNTSLVGEDGLDKSGLSTLVDLKNAVKEKYLFLTRFPMFDLSKRWSKVNSREICRWRDDTDSLFVYGIADEAECGNACGIFIMRTPEQNDDSLLAVCTTLVSKETEPQCYAVRFNLPNIPDFPTSVREIHISGDKAVFLHTSDANTSQISSVRLKDIVNAVRPLHASDNIPTNTVPLQSTEQVQIGLVGRKSIIKQNTRLTQAGAVLADDLQRIVIYEM